MNPEYCEAKDGAECYEWAYEGTVAYDLCSKQCSVSYGAPCAYNHICYNLTNICTLYGSTGQSDDHTRKSPKDKKKFIESIRRLTEHHRADDDATSDCDPHMNACWGCAATNYLSDNFDVPGTDDSPSDILTDNRWAHYHIELLNMLPTVCLELTLAGFNTSCTLHDGDSSVDCS
mmetsp:Transcript_4149/g.5291  ORF Transcript_4149/g.5291 Transcript_4149/m.5291 type:complete len:175 (-) Transcript_4149:182-706(-)